MSQYARRGTQRVCAASRLFPLLILTVAVLNPRPAYTQTLPSGWTGSNVGAPSLSGRASYSGATFNVEGAGTRVGLVADQFYYVHQRITGDVTIIARVASIEYTHRSAKAGVMVRESLTSSSRHAFALVTPARGIGFHRRTSTNGRTTGTNVTGAAPVWLKLVRSGSTFTASRSNNGTTWTTIARTTISMKSTVYVGLAVSSYNPGRRATGMFTNVSVTGRAPVPAPATRLTPPTVSLTSPSGGTYTAPATIGLVASASDPDDGVAQVEFYANGALLGIARRAPYGYAWFGVGAGTYSLTAVARDTRGAVATSAARSITVKGGSTSNTPPTVALTAPAAGSTFLAPARVTIAANAADANGSIARVDFYAGSTLVGSDTSSPYSVTWVNAPAGSFSLVAVARDNAGAATTSSARGISITSPPMPKRAVFSPSASHATVTRYNLDIFTAGANPASAVPIATRNLGKPAVVNGTCTVDITTTISALPGGNYFASVVAVSSGGTSTRAVSPTFAR
jgi:regulation of enolase protein 1 (concanavalin A-like superfamily)